MNALIRQQAFINGEWRDADHGGRHAVHNPATGELIAEVPDMGADETRAAIAAAEAALPAWRARPAKERSNLLRKWFDLVMANQEALAQLMTAEQGKPLAEARGEVAYGASFIEWFAEEGKRVYGETIPAPSADRRLIVLRQPVGVIAAITPWNFPVAMITRKVAPALAVGCTTVVKPAEATPLCALALAALAQEAGIPAGVLNIVTTARPAAVGDELTRNPTVRKLSFTGSTGVGKHLMAACAGTVKRLSLELGGNAPFIVLDDADLDAAVLGALASKYRNAGQTCVCANRLYAQAGIYERFVEKLTAKVAEMKVGNGFEAGVVQGPLIDGQALAKVEELLGDAMAKGAKVRTGGKRAVVAPELATGAFFEPTVLSDVDASMRVAREEIFGPVAPVFKFDSEADAIRLANDTEFGLASYFYSRDVGRIWRVSEGLEYGMVGVNTGIISTCEVPFGGVKQSGLGREGARQGIEDYVEAKYVCLGGLDR